MEIDWVFEWDLMMAVLKGEMDSYSVAQTVGSTDVETVFEKVALMV